MAPRSRCTSTPSTHISSFYPNEKGRDSLCAVSRSLEGGRIKYPARSHGMLFILSFSTRPIMNSVKIAAPSSPDRRWDEPVPLQTLKSIEDARSTISTPPPIHTPPTLSRSIYPLSRESSLPVLGTDALLTRRKPDRYKFRLGSAFMSFFVCGWADGSE